MRALVIAVHGSRIETANDELRQLTRRLGEAHADTWDRVAIGFLEFGQPSLLQALHGLADAGAHSVTVVPLFLSTGRHVSTDIPAAVAECARLHPQLPLVLAPHLGAWEGLGTAVAALAKETESRRA